MYFIIKVYIWAKSWEKKRYFHYNTCVGNVWDLLFIFVLSAIYFMHMFNLSDGPRCCGDQTTLIVFVSKVIHCQKLFRFLKNAVNEWKSSNDCLKFSFGKRKSSTLNVAMRIQSVFGGATNQ